MADISPSSGELHFASGDRLKTIVFRTLPDQILEGAETYSVELVSATGGAEISPVARIAKVKNFYSYLGFLFYYSVFTIHTKL